LAHRADPNDARLPSQLGVDGSNVESALRTPGGRKASGGALLSVLSVSLPTWPSALRSKDPAQQRMVPLESDYEGTIGGKDGEIPMAKRIQKNQGRFACDASTEVPTPKMQRQSMDQFSPLPNRLSAATYQGTPRTPGLAGVGSMWMRGGVHPISSPLPVARVTPGSTFGPRQPTFAELQRQPISHQEANRWSFQTTMDKWMEDGRYTSMPPPPSRRGSSNSFITNCDMSQVGGVVAARQVASDAGNGVERMVSIRPHFAPTTTLASWLIQEEQGRDSGREEESIIEKYLVEGSQVSSDTDFDRKRGMLWEVEESLPPSYHSEMNLSLNQPTKPLSIKSRSGESQQGGHKMRPQGWGQEEERLEEEKRQIDRRQRMLLKEKKRVERRMTRQLQRQDQQQKQAEGVDQFERSREQQQQMHLVLEMDPFVDNADIQEEERLRLRLEPSFNDFNAPVLSHGDIVVSQARRHSNTSKIVLANRPPTRAILLSPPESPLTSASEGPAYGRRAPGNFLVASSSKGSKSSGSHRCGSNRSVSHGALLSMHSPDPTKLESLVQSKRLPKKHHSHHRSSKRSASEKHYSVDV